MKCKSLVIFQKPRRLFKDPENAFLKLLDMSDEILHEHSFLPKLETFRLIYRVDFCICIWVMVHISMHPSEYTQKVFVFFPPNLKFDAHYWSYSLVLHENKNQVFRGCNNTFSRDVPDSETFACCSYHLQYQLTSVYNNPCMAVIIVVWPGSG